MVGRCSLKERQMVAKAVSPASEIFHNRGFDPVHPAAVAYRANG
jgi:hypothetical protein